MISVDRIKVYNIANAIYSARNPLNSWEKSDSDLERDIVGSNDLDLMKRLYKAGSEHRKYLRQIFVSMDITAPLYWWKEFDTYKVGTVSNSCSTMHKIAAKEFELSDFSIEHVAEDILTIAYDVVKYTNSPMDCFLDLIDVLNACRQKYLDTKDKKWWWQLIQLLPSSYNQKRTITMNYENVITIIKQRTNHKLDEWNDFIKELKFLPYVNEIIEETE